MTEAGVAAPTRDQPINAPPRTSKANPASAKPGPPPSRFLRRLPLLALALVALIAALWAGLQRLGLDLPELQPALATLHGPLFVLGFLGTQIGLERAVALRRPWPYIAPAMAGAGSLWLIVGLPQEVGQWMLLIGGVVLVGVFVVVHRMQATWHNTVMGLGALGWAVAAGVWLAGGAMADVVPWLVCFLVLTIVGERLEISRMAPPQPAARMVLLAAVAVFLIGITVAMQWHDLGIRLAGAGLLAQAFWLGRYDVARRTIRMAAATRFMAISLIAGYFWLIVAGAAWIGEGTLTGGGFAYDAMVHAIFVGFVFSMVFAHASIIVPAVLGVPLPFRKVFYLPLVLLHGGLIVRLIGDAIEHTRMWQVGGVLNEIAILLFIGLSIQSSVSATRAKRDVAARASVARAAANA